MIDGRILVEIGLKRHFGSILAVMGSHQPRARAHLCSSASSPRLERKYAQVHFPWAQAHACVQYTATILFLGKSCHSPTWTRWCKEKSSIRFEDYFLNKISPRMKESYKYSKIIFRIIYFTFCTNILFCLKGYGFFCIFISFSFSKYYAWKVFKLCLYKGRSVLFWNQVLNYQLNFKTIRVISLFAYLGQLWVTTSLFLSSWIPLSSFNS